MNNSKWGSRAGLVIVWGLILLVLAGVGCSAVPDFDSRLRSIVRPYTFSIVQWEFGAIPREIGESFGNRGEEVGDEMSTVIQYFSVMAQIRVLKSELEASGAGGKTGNMTSLEAELGRLQKKRVELVPAVERIIAGQIKETLVRHGIFNPFVALNVSFPPLSFTLEAPPHLLVVSPRDRIESMREVTLKQSLDVYEIYSIESQVDELGVSSLVLEIGGFGGTYPTFVSDSGGLQFTLEAATEEWLHQYLAFTPLGFAYVLDSTGVSRNYEIATMNETVAGMVSKEIGAAAYANYYSDGGGAEPAPDTEFNREMRQIRMTVDELLDRGQVEEAESFMEERRQYLLSRGYYIRKLNQAYFAFYGTYADRPTSISPIGAELKALRAQSESLKDFLDRASRMTIRADLQQSIK